MNNQRLFRIAAVAVATCGLAAAATISGLPNMLLGDSSASPRDRVAEKITLIAQAPATPSAPPPEAVAPIATPAALTPTVAPPVAEITAAAVQVPASADMNTMVAPAVLPAKTTAPADPSCRTDLAIIAQPGAMVDVGLIAPCRPEERVVIRHGDLVISGKTSAAGTLIAAIPAFTSPAEITLSLPDGTEVTDSVAIPDLAQYERYAVQWVAGDSFALNAFLEGADWDSTGHITATRGEAPSSKGGFLLQSGDPTSDRPLLAQSYTWPMGRSSSDPAIELTLESEVTPATCGREVLAETLHMVDGKTTLHELTLDMPPCEAVGEFLVLSNPFTLTTGAQN